MTLLLQSIVLLGLGAPTAPDPELFGPLHIEPGRDDAPALVVRRMTALPLAAVRLSIDLPAEPGAGDAAGVLQELARGRMETRAARYGARVGMELTATHVVYEIVGPADAFSDLVGVLREAVTRPPLDGRAASRAWMRYRSRALIEYETPQPVVLRLLRNRLFPELASTAAGADAARPGVEALARFWAASYRPERMRAVVVGDIDADAARSAFGEWAVPTESADREPEPEDEPASAGEAEPTGTDPQLLFAWAGLGFRVGDVDAAGAMLAARLLEHRLRAEGVDSPRADLWWSGDRQALVLSGSARRTGVVPGPDEAAADAARLTELMRRTATQTAAFLTAGQVAAARAELQREMLLAARTPAGLARLIGTFLDRSGDPDSALRFWNALGKADVPEVRRTLLALLSAPEVTVEVVP